MKLDGYLSGLRLLQLNGGAEQILVRKVGDDEEGRYCRVWATKDSTRVTLVDGTMVSRSVVASGSLSWISNKKIREMWRRGLIRDVTPKMKPEGKEEPAVI